MIFKLWRELSKMTVKDRLPRLPRTLRNEFEPDELDEDLGLVLMTGRAVDPESARQLVASSGAATGAEYVRAHRPRPPRPDRRRRFENWLRRMEGSTPSEQVVSRYLAHQKAKPVKSGIREVPFKGELS